MSNADELAAWTARVAAEIATTFAKDPEAGYQVDIVSPSGGKLQIDSYSDPRDASGYSASDILSLPMGPQLSDAQVDYVIDCLQQH